MKSRSRSFLLCCLVSAASFGGAQCLTQDESLIEIKDAEGVVRMRLGQLDDAGKVFGWQLLDSGGEVCASTFLDGNVVETSVGSPKRPETMLRSRSEPDGVQLVFGDATAASVFMGLSRDGRMRWSCRDKDQKVWLDMKCAAVPNGGASIELTGKSKNGDEPHIKLATSGDIAVVEATASGGSGARVEAKPGGVSRFLLGSETNGIYLQAADVANLLELRRGKPVVTLQAGRGGAGLGVDRPDGSTGLRLGVSASGEVKHNIK